MERTDVRFHEWLIEGLGLYNRHFKLLVLTMLLVFLVSISTAGILAGPMLAGLVRIVLALYRGETRRVRDIFSGFGHFGSMFIFCLVWGLCIGLPAAALTFLPVFGKALALVFSLFVYGFLMFGPFLIVDQGMGFWPASVKSIKTVGANLWPYLEFGALTAILGQIGALLCGLGIVFTMPFQICMLVVAYGEVFCGIVTDSAVRQDPDAAHTIAAAAAQRVLSGKESGDQAVRAAMVRSRIETPEESIAWEMTEEEIEEIERSDRAKPKKKAAKAGHRPQKPRT